MFDKLIYGAFRLFVPLHNSLLFSYFLRTCGFLLEFLSHTLKCKPMAAQLLSHSLVGPSGFLPFIVFNSDILSLTLGCNWQSTKSIDQ